MQRWDKEKILIANRNPKGRRYYTHEQYVNFMGIKDKKNKKTVIYARVSSSNQKDDLENQVEFLKTYANAKGIIIDEVITDIGSGLNYNRKKWNELLDDCIQQKIETIIISNKDRFIRFGYEWFEQFISNYGVKIVVVNNDKLSPNEELVQDLISIIHVFSCKVYGLRKYKKTIREDKDVNNL